MNSMSQSMGQFGATATGAATAAASAAAAAVMAQQRKDNEAYQLAAR